MKKFAVAAALVLTFLVLPSLTFPVAAQTHPDFSGTWIFNKPRSSGLPYLMSNLKEFTKTVSVNQELNQFTVTSFLSLGHFEPKRGERGYLPFRFRDMTFNLDGSERKIEATGLLPEALVSAQWKGQALELVQRLSHQTSSGVVIHILMVEQWELSDDGKFATIHQTIDSGLGRQDMILVFERK